MVQNVKTGRDVLMNFWLLDVACNVVEEVCWYWQVIILNHCHHYFHHVFPPCCQGSRCWWKTSWKTSQPPLQSVISGGLKIEDCLISPSHVSKQIWLVELSFSIAVPPTLHFLSWLLVHHQSHHKRGPTRRERKRKRSRKGMRMENWQQQPTPPASSCPPNYCASLAQSTHPHPAERSSHTCDQKSNMIATLTNLYICIYWLCIRNRTCTYFYRNNHYKESVHWAFSSLSTFINGMILATTRCFFLLFRPKND